MAEDPELCLFLHRGMSKMLGSWWGEVGRRRGHHALRGPAAPGAHWLAEYGGGELPRDVYWEAMLLAFAVGPTDKVRGLAPCHHWERW